MQVHVYHRVWYPQRVLRTRARDPEIIRLCLDPAKRELRAFLDHLKIQKTSHFGRSYLARMSLGLQRKQPAVLHCLQGECRHDEGAARAHPHPLGLLLFGE
jgi:hypothetical protein